MTVIATPSAARWRSRASWAGLDTEVTDATVDILLEAATFEAGRTSRTSRNLGLISESSMRYERGVDDHGIEARSAAAAALVAAVSGGTVSRAAGNAEGIVDAWPRVSEAPRLQFRIPRFCAMMGAGHPARLRGGRAAPPGLRSGRGSRRRRARRDRPHVPSRPRARDRPVRGSAAPVGHGPRPGHASQRARARGRAHPGGARDGRGERHAARMRPQRDDDLFVRRTGRSGAFAHAARGAG